MLVETYVSNIIENRTGFGYIVGSGDKEGEGVFLPPRVIPDAAVAGDILEVFVLPNKTDPTGRSPWAAVGPIPPEKLMKVDAGHGKTELQCTDPSLFSHLKFIVEDDDEEEEDEGRPFTAKDVVDHVIAAEAPLTDEDLFLVFRATTSDEKTLIRRSLNAASHSGELCDIVVTQVVRNGEIMYHYYADSAETAHDWLTSE